MTLVERKKKCLDKIAKYQLVEKQDPLKIFAKVKRDQLQGKEKQEKILEKQNKFLEKFEKRRLVKNNNKNIRSG